MLTLLGGFDELLAEIDNRATILMGHTRWLTRCCGRNYLNNHPIRALDVWGTHNGTVYKFEWLFTRFRMRARTDLDSEILVRAAARAWRSRELDTEALKANKPLALWWHRKHRVVAYASDEDYLDDALVGERGWRPLDVPPMSLFFFDTNRLLDFANDEFPYRAHEPRCT